MTTEERAETAYWLFVEVHAALADGHAILSRESFDSFEPRKRVWLTIADLAGKWRLSGVDAAKDLYDRVHGEIHVSMHSSMDYDERCPPVRRAWRAIARALERRAAG